jgi:RNA polymerase sigma-70 factor (ECF subfamily)
VVGADKVARFLIGVGTRVPPGTTVDVEEVNGRECVVARADGRPTQVISFEVERDRLLSMQIVANPEKLSRI